MEKGREREDVEVILLSGRIKGKRGSRESKGQKENAKKAKKNQKSPRLPDIRFILLHGACDGIWRRCLWRDERFARYLKANAILSCLAPHSPSLCQVVPLPPLRKPPEMVYLVPGTGHQASRQTLGNGINLVHGSLSLLFTLPFLSVLLVSRPDDVAYVLRI